MTDENHNLIVDILQNLQADIADLKKTSAILAVI